jgi:broad specificity phosphatase PhoE
MKKIWLVRHGKPRCQKNVKLNRQGLHGWLISYDLSGIRQDSKPDPLLIEAASLPTCRVWCSDLPRSVESACLLTTHFQQDAIFRENDLPVAPVPIVRLPMRAWDVIGKVLWVCGYSPRVESFQAARRRAKLAAEKLVAEAAESSDVILAGHGFFNLLIGLELKRIGFQSESHSPLSHWGHRLFYRD